MLRSTNSRLNKRIGDEILSDSDDSVFSVDNYPSENVVNTRNYQLDGQFAKHHYFITNVRLIDLFLLKLNTNGFQCSIVTRRSAVLERKASNQIGSY